MLGKNPIVTFLAAKDPQRTIAFYRDKLGLRFVSQDQFAVVFDANGIMLRIQMVPKPTVAPYTALGWEVPSIAAAVKKLVKAGVVFERYPGMPQDELGIWKAPSGARVAWFKDPDGHTLSLSQAGKE